MKKSVLELGEKDAIHAETEEQAFALCELFDSLGLKLSNGNNYLHIKFWQWSKGDICFYPKKGDASKLKIAVKNGFAIHKATDFISATEEERKWVGGVIKDGEVFTEVEIKACEDFEKQTDLEILKIYLRAKLILAEEYKDVSTANEIISKIESYNLL